MTEYASPLLISSAPDKAERRQAQRAQETEEVQAVLQACRGPCLTWTSRDGWVVKDALAPDGAVSRRQRLLGIAAARPKFWLYISGWKFVARHCTVPLQALGETAREAIEALRVSVRRHIALYGAAAHGERRSRLMENKQCSDEDRSLELTDRLYRLHIEFLRDRQGFWKSATDASILTK